MTSKFNQSLLTVIAVAVSAVAIMMILTTISGPRLRHVAVDTRAVTAKTGQRLSLQANQPLRKVTADMVSISPAVDVGVATSANRITVTFKQRLAYHTQYRVTIKAVRPAYGGDKQVDFNYNFTTYDPYIYMLQRGGEFGRTGGEDNIVRRRLSGGAVQTVFTAQRISDFVIVGERLVVNLTGQDKVSRLKLVSADGGEASDVQLPAAGLVDKLQASADGQSYGFRFTSAGQGEEVMYQDNLFVHNLSPGHRLTALDGISGRPLQVLDWQWSADGLAVVAQQFDGNLMLADVSSGNLPVALGQFPSMENFSVKGTELLVRDESGLALLDIPKRKLATAGLDAEFTAQAGEPVGGRMLNNQDGQILHMRWLEAGKEQGRLVTVTGKQARQLYGYRPAERNIVSYGSSSNDQYLIVRDAEVGQQYDGYFGNAAPLDGHILLIEINSGKRQEIKAVKIDIKA